MPDTGPVYSRGPQLVPEPDNVTKLAQQTRRSLVLRGILAIVMGVLIIARPGASVAAFALVIAIWALIDGAVLISYAFRLKPIAPHWWALLLAGIVGVAFGGFALYYYPALSLAYAVVWTTVWLVSIGAAAIYAATRERKLGLRWGWTMAFGVLAVLAGVVAVIYPGATIGALLAIIATFALVAGITMLVAAGKMRSLENRAKDVFEGPKRV
ncbi:MAG TPA: DUF308 domain-containing protein [Gemmatimonadaceae bacterium]|nr:DUF308 domain-containing protein [Gemmatimonadaceae bacterium]